jgi:hypothetical protein
MAGRIATPFVAAGEDFSAVSAAWFGGLSAWLPNQKAP